MPEGAKDLLAVELGRRGGLARSSRQTPEERQAIARLGGIARAARAAEQRGREELLPGQVTPMMPIEITPWRGLKLIKGDVEEYIYKNWTHKIPRAYEELLQAAMKAGNTQLALQVLMAMTAMSPLTPARLKQVAGKAIERLSPEPDLSHLDDETLELARRLASNATIDDDTRAQLIRKLTTAPRRPPTSASFTAEEAEPKHADGGDADAKLTDASAPPSASSSPLSSQTTVEAGVTRADLLAALGISPTEAPDGRALLAALCR
jgi:hypothetical protein